VPAEAGWIIKRNAADPTSGSLQTADLTGRSLQGTDSEGHACHARRSGMDNPTLYSGPDKRVPPNGGRGKGVPPGSEP